MTIARVILFKPSGKYYTEEGWRIPTKEEALAAGMTSPGDMVTPYAMRWSPDFRRIGGGSVLVETQEPWGYPHLITPEAEVYAEPVVTTPAMRTAPHVPQGGALRFLHHYGEPPEGYDYMLEREDHVGED